MDQTQKLSLLAELRRVYKSKESVLARISALEEALTFPKGAIHVISDIHGENKKLRHVINSASGCLKPLLEGIYRGRLSREEQQTVLNFLHYPSEAFSLLKNELRDDEQRRIRVSQIISFEVEVLRDLAARYPLERLEEILPRDYRMLLNELLFAPQLLRSERHLKAALATFLDHGKEEELLRIVARAVRNMLFSELIIAGDFGDRGPRMDKVIDYVMHQPKVSLTWGNHDVSWMGACLGHELCIATVVRISLRYRRLSQLEEGYGIPMAPLEKLARTVYESDPATCFACKGEGLRDPELMARMQKAIAIIQFKLEGQLSRRNPHLALEHRDLLSHVDQKSGTVEVCGVKYPLRDKHFPTVDWNSPLELSVEERSCLERIRRSFLQSPILWEQMCFLAQKGSMYVVRDGHLIFHACVPVDEGGEFQQLSINAKPYMGRELFERLNVLIKDAFEHRRGSDLDMLWYLWGGARSPLFGKDKMATFETYFIEDKATHKEAKNPYFKLIHEKDFCRKILSEFGVESPHALIVNGHVPVKIEAGESPLKKSEMAVTIDGAFSEAYGDKGYTLVLEADRTYIAQHHHFDSVDEVLTKGADIVPSIQELRRFTNLRMVSDTEEGERLRGQIALLKDVFSLSGE